MNENDTRYSAPIRIDGAGPSMVVGVPSGSMQSALNQSSVKVSAAMSRLRGTAAEIRMHIELPSARAGRLAELKAPAIQAVREHAAVLAAERHRIGVLEKTASYVRPAAQGWQMFEDLALAQKFSSMTLSERTQLAAEVLRDPVQQLRWSEVLQRVAPELTGVDRQMRDEIRRATLQAFSPETLAAIEAQVEQLELAERALDLSRQVLAESLPGSLADLQQEPQPEPLPSYMNPVPDPAVVAHFQGDWSAPLKP